MSTAFKNNLIRLTSVDSTNNYAFSVGEKCAVVSEFQTAGKGRMGRFFVADLGKSLLLSVLEKDVVSPELTAWVAVCVHKALTELSDMDCRIKWPNDIQVNGKKICGILVERKGDAVVIGMGINLYQDDFRELSDIATSARLCDAEIDKDELMYSILDKLDRMLTDFPQKRSEYLEYYRKHCSTVGCSISLISGEEKTPAFCTGVNEYFELEVRLEDGSMKTVSSGEISVRPAV